MQSSMMSSIKPFKINVPDAKIDRLKQKLARSDFPDEVSDEEPWKRGVPLSDLKRLSKYWAEGFDWRKAETKLNQMSQYTADIDVDGYGSYNLHFVYHESPHKNAIPLLFVHGWPGSFIEVSKILPELLQGGKDTPAFHVVAPSLMDFGFSDRSGKKGFTVAKHGEAFNKLMHLLGFNEYVVQGGDLGYHIARSMAQHYPESVKAHHINMATPKEPTLTEFPTLYAQVKATPLSESEKAGLERTKWFRKEGSGYNKEHSTKPQTIGYSMTDSPVGLLAWIYEKLHDWTDSYPWTDDEILTWISIYYFSKAGPAATQRIYYESAHDSSGESAENYSDVKLGIARFPRELMLHPKLWHHTLGPIVLFSEYDKGGHFAAWERPDAIVKDLREMYGRAGGAYRCVDGRTGFDDDIQHHL